VLALSNVVARLGWYMIGQVAIKLLFLVGVVAAARAAGPTGWGLLTAAISAGFILITGVNLGLNPYVTREVAVSKYPLKQLAAAGARYRLVTSALFAGVVPLVLLPTVPDMTIRLALAVSAYLLTDSWAKYVFAFLRGAERTRYEVIGGISEKILFAFVAVAAISGSTISARITLVAIAFASAATAKLGVSLHGAKRIFHQSVVPFAFVLRRFFDTAVWKSEFRFIRECAPFLFMAVFSTIYFRIDSYMLATLGSNEEAGYYGAAYRLVEGLLFAPESVLVVFTPLLVRTLNPATSPQATAREPRIISQIAALQTAIVGCVAAGIMLEHSWIIHQLYGEAFADSAPLLLGLGPAFVFMGLNFLLGGILTATYRQNALFKITVVGVIVNVSLNAFAIPRYGAVGAVVATVITEGGVCLLMLSEVPAKVSRWQLGRAIGTVGVPLLALVVVPSILLREYLSSGLRVGLELATVTLLLVVLVRTRVVPNPIPPLLASVRTQTERSSHP
jgi:O-antigen/teichoic acid export membrane protein